MAEIRVAALNLDFAYQGGPRDFAAERRARQVIESLGAVELSSLDDAEVMPGARVDYVCAIDGDVHALCAFARMRCRSCASSAGRSRSIPTIRGRSSAARRRSTPTSSQTRAARLVRPRARRRDRRPSRQPLARAARDPRSARRTSRRSRARAPLHRGAASTTSAGCRCRRARLKLLAKVLLELYRDGERVECAAGPRAAALAELGAALHDGRAPVRWTGDTKLRDQGYALALGPRRRDAAMPLEGLQRRAAPVSDAKASRGCSTCAQHDAGGILADDMGLGKTLQTIAHMLAEKQRGPPRSPGDDRHADEPASATGQRELEKFAPALRVARAVTAPRASEARRAPRSHDVVITTYPLVARDRDELAESPLHLLVLDEAHAIKNVDARRRADAVRALDGAPRVCLTGTPIENHLGELWSLFDFLNPGLLGTADEFRTSSATPIEQQGDAQPPRGAPRSRAAVHPAPHEGRGRARSCRRRPSSCAPSSSTARSASCTSRSASRRTPRSAQHIKQRGLARRARSRSSTRCSSCARSAAIRGSPTVEAARQRARVGEARRCCSSCSTKQLAEGRRVLVFSQFARMLGARSARRCSRKRHRPRHAHRPDAGPPEADRRVPERRARTCS